MDEKPHSVMLNQSRTAEKYEGSCIPRAINKPSVIRSKQQDRISHIPKLGTKISTSKVNMNLNPNSKTKSKIYLHGNTNHNNGNCINDQVARRLNEGTLRIKRDPSLATIPNSNRKNKGRVFSNKHQDSPNLQDDSSTTGKIIHEDANNNKNGTNDTPSSKSPLTGNGLGGGSVSKTGFSYVHGAELSSYRKSEFHSWTSSTNSGSTTLIHSYDHRNSATLLSTGHKDDEVANQHKRRQPFFVAKKELQNTASIQANIEQFNSKPKDNTLAASKCEIGSNSSKLNSDNVLKTPICSSIRHIPPPTAPKPSVSKLAEKFGKEAQFKSSVDGSSRSPSSKLKTMITRHGMLQSLMQNQIVKGGSTPQVSLFQEPPKIVSDVVSKSDIDITRFNPSMSNHNCKPVLDKEASMSSPNLIPFQLWNQQKNETIENKIGQLQGGHIGKDRHTDPYVLFSSKPKNGPRNDRQNESATLEQNSKHSHQHNQNLMLENEATSSKALVLHPTKNDIVVSSQACQPSTNFSDKAILTVHEEKIIQQCLPISSNPKSVKKIPSDTLVDSSDSSLCNTSRLSLPEQRQHLLMQKKVSFQDNVMVSDGRGNNTYLQRLKTKGEQRESLLSKSCDDKKKISTAVPCCNAVAECNDIYMKDHPISSPTLIMHLTVDQSISNPIKVRQSAVEAAIVTMTGKPSSRKVTINDSYKAATQGSVVKGHQVQSATQKTNPAQVESIVADGPLPKYNTDNTFFLQNVEHQDSCQQNFNELSLTSKQYNPQIWPMAPNFGFKIEKSAEDYQTSHSVIELRPIGKVTCKNSNQKESVSHTQVDPYFQTQSGFPNVNIQGKNTAWTSAATPYYESCSNKQGVENQFSIECGTENDNLTDERDNTIVPAEKSYGSSYESLAVDSPYQYQQDEYVEPSCGEKVDKKMKNTETLKPACNKEYAVMDDMSKNMLRLRATAADLKRQLDEVRRQQRTNWQCVTDLITKRTKELNSLIARTAFSEYGPDRSRRLIIDRERSTYGEKVTGTEHQLSDIEAAVEELRNEVVGRRCRVNTREVEALALQLSQAGRTIARLKNHFPSLCEDMRKVGAFETEVIIQEEKFLDKEPARLDEQLKRCKQLTQTLYTLKKLASVQEARSKTPVNLLDGSTMVQRPETPSQYLNSLYLASRRDCEDMKLARNHILDEIRAQKIDSTDRIKSIDEAEKCWTRRVNYIKQYDSRKFEKALELTEKALRKTNNLRIIEEQRRRQFKELFTQKDDECHEEYDRSSAESTSVKPFPSTTKLCQRTEPVIQSSSAVQFTNTPANLDYISSDIHSVKAQEPVYISPPVCSYETTPTSVQFQSNIYVQQFSNENSAIVQHLPRSNSLQRPRILPQCIQKRQYEEYKMQRTMTQDRFITDFSRVIRNSKNSGVRYQCYKNNPDYFRDHENYNNQRNRFSESSHSLKGQSEAMRPRQSKYVPTEEHCETTKKIMGKSYHLRRPTKFTSKLNTSSSLDTRMGE